MEQKFKNHEWKGEHPCGTGSIFKNTETTRNFLVNITKKYNIKTISNAGAGIPDWINKLKWPHPVIIKHYDIDIKRKDVIKFDITTEVLPKTDLIICRHVLNHLYSWKNLITAAMNNFEKSGSTYILHSHDHRTDFLYTELGEPLETVTDKAFKKGKTKWQYTLWRINDG